MRKLRKLVCVFLLVCFVLLPGMNLKPALASSPSSPSLKAADLEIFLDKVIEEQMKEFNIPTLTVSVVADGEVILARGYGYEDIEEGKPVDPDKTMFRIGSTWKLFTWTAVMQLVEQGKLDLDADVNEYLDFEIPSKLEYGKEKTVEPITLRHLMSHTPVFEDYMTRVFAEELLPLDRYIREERPARVFPPGKG